MEIPTIIFAWVSETPLNLNFKIKLIKALLIYYIIYKCLSFLISPRCMTSFVKEFNDTHISYNHYSILDTVYLQRLYKEKVIEQNRRSVQIT